MNKQYIVKLGPVYKKYKTLWDDYEKSKELDTKKFKEFKKDLFNVFNKHKNKIKSLTSVGRFKDFTRLINKIVGPSNNVDNLMRVLQDIEALLWGKVDIQENKNNDNKIRLIIRDILRSELSNQSEQAISYGPDNLGHTVRMWNTKDTSKQLKRFKKDSHDAVKKADMSKIMDDDQEIIDDLEDEKSIKKKNEEKNILLPEFQQDIDTISMSTKSTPISAFAAFIKNKGDYDPEKTKKVDELIDKLTNRFNGEFEKESLKRDEMEKLGLINLVKIKK